MSKADNVDVSNIDQMFEYTVDMARIVIKETLRALDRNSMAENRKAKIIYDALKNNFSIEQIWERLKEKDKELVFPLLRPEEIVQLRQAGLFKKPEPEEEQDAG